MSTLAEVICFDIFGEAKNCGRADGFSALNWILFKTLV